MNKILFFAYSLLFLTRYISAIPDWITQSDLTIRKNVQSATNFIVTIPDPQNKNILSAAAFGLSVTNSPAGNAAAIQNAINACKERGITELLLPPGQFKIGRLEGNPNEDLITKSSNYSHYTGRIYQIKIIGMTNFIFNGQNAELIFSDLPGIPSDKSRLGAYIIIKDCSKVFIKNLVLDWDWENHPLYFYGEISQIDQELSTIDYSLKGTFFPEDLQVEIMREWDPVKKARRPDIFSLAMGNVKNHKLINSRTIRFAMGKNENVTGAGHGQWGMFKAKTKWKPQGFNIDINQNLTLSNIHIYGTPQNAVWARQNKNLRITGCVIGPRPGTEQIATCNGALEIHNHFGGFILENCEISYPLDDVLHFSDFFLPGSVKKINDHKMEVGGLMYFQSADTFIKNSTLEFRTADYEPIGFTAKIADYFWTMVEGKGQAKHFVTITTKEKLPRDMKPDTLLFNTSYGIGGYIIRNNKISHGLCHGLYVCMGNGLIENNEIIGTAYPALMVHSVIRWGRWPMGHPPSNVIIRGNKIAQCNTALRQPADVFIGGGRDPQGGTYQPVEYPVAQNIILEKNIIEGTPWQAVTAWSCSNVLLINNVIRDPNNVSSPEGRKGTIFIQNASQVYIAGNERKIISGRPLDDGISISEHNSKNIVIGENKGFGNLNPDGNEVKMKYLRTFPPGSVIIKGDGSAALTADGNKLLVRVGKYSVSFNKEKAWTIESINFSDTPLLSGMPGNQTQLSEKTEKGISPFIGSSVGARGEELLEAELIACGQTHELDAGLDVQNCGIFTLKKISRFGAYEQISHVSVTENGLKEAVYFKVISSTEQVNFIYAFVHKFENGMKQWIAADVNGKIHNGRLTDDDSFSMLLDLGWTSLYNPENRTAAIISYPENYKGWPTMKNSFWNRRNEKILYFKVDPKKNPGDEFGYELTFQAFISDETMWKSEAAERVRKTFAEYRSRKPYLYTTSLPDSAFIIPGSETSGVNKSIQATTQKSEGLNINKKYPPAWQILKGSGHAAVSNNGQMITISVENYTVDLSASKSWTILQAGYDGRPLLINSGHHQAVIFEKVNAGTDPFIGTGHRPEEILDIKLIGNGQPYDVEPGMEISDCGNIAFRRHTRIGPFEQVSHIVISSEGIRESCWFTVTGDTSKTEYMYPFMHIFDNSMNKWIARDAEGNISQGELTDDNSFTMKKDILWTAVYSADMELAVILVYPEAYSGWPSFKNAWWNRKTDNKLYFKVNPERQPGKEFGYEIIVQGYNTGEKKWKEEAVKRADSVIKKF